MAPWIAIRLDLYRQLRRQVEFLLGGEDKELKEYRAIFEKEFSRNWRPALKKEFLAQLNRADLVFLADFHALQQSQKAQLRILRNLDSKREKWIGVECLFSEHQNLLNLFMQGKISENDFMEKVDWHRNWGFPWEHYRPLFKFAQKRGIPVVALNRRLSKTEKNGLKRRDEFSAEKIAEYQKKYLGYQAIVIYGDMHLADSHIPQKLSLYPTLPKPLKIVSVFQNSEKIYFKLLEKELDSSVDIVRLGENKFCLNSVPPWVKWQNYLMFLEQNLDRELGSGVMELTDHVSRYLKVLVKDLDLDISNDFFSVYTAADTHFWDLVQERASPQLLKHFKSLVQQSRSFYWPEQQVAYLARSSVNHASSLAMAIIHSRLSGMKDVPLWREEDFLKCIWLEAVQYLGSKFVNPKLKTETYQDLKFQLQALSAQEKEPLQLAISQRMKEALILMGEISKGVRFRPRRASAYFLASRLLGGIVGERIYAGHRKRMLSLSALKNILSRPVDGPGFQEIYYSLLEIIEGLPEPSVSKLEKL